MSTEHVNRTHEGKWKRSPSFIHIHSLLIHTICLQIGSREWDSGKQGGQWKDTRPPTSDDQEPTARDGPSEIAPRGGRDGGRGRGRGRGRGGGSGPAPGPAPQAAAPQAAADDPKPDTKTNNTAAPVVAAKDS